jgi:hypothetical protein
MLYFVSKKERKNELHVCVGAQKKRDRNNNSKANNNIENKQNKQQEYTRKRKKKRSRNKKQKEYHNTMCSVSLCFLLVFLSKPGKKEM